MLVVFAEIRISKTKMLKLAAFLTFSRYQKFKASKTIIDITIENQSAGKNLLIANLMKGAYF